MIEMLGILAILTILVTIILATTTRSLDIAAANQESTNLLSCATALQNSILRNRYIPGPNDWATVIATELGASVSSITNTPRNLPRYFVIDPSLRIGTNAAGVLPYSQNSTILSLGGASNTNQPLSPRVMLVSSISTPLPAFITNGVASSANFSNLWNWNDQSAAPPAGWPATWNSRGNDLKVQRVELAPLFVHLTLQNYPPPPLYTNQGQYAIDRLVTNQIPNGAINGINTYLIDSTILGLFQDAGSGGALQAEQILARDTSFFYVEGVWQSSLNMGQPASSVSTASAMATTFAATAAAFTVSPYYSLAASGATPKTVLNTMSNFMVAYNSWANSGYSTSGTNASYLNAKNAQSAMVTEMQNLANGFIQSGPTEGACTNPPGM